MQRVMKSIEFEITTTEKRSDWVYLAANKCSELGIDTRDCGCFKINGKIMSFEFDSDLKINGLIRNF